jgi:hypothetical protein
VSNLAYRVILPNAQGFDAELSEHEAGSLAQSIADMLAAFCPVVNACVMCQWNGILSEAA